MRYFSATLEGVPQVGMRAKKGDRPKERRFLGIITCLASGEVFFSPVPF
jgi:hypothetical protein